MVVKGINSMRREQAAAPPPPTSKLCSQCQMEIPIKAVKCGHCASGVS